MEKIEGTSPTRVRQAQQRRDRIINASMKLFQEKCVEDTSMEEVAKRAGVGAATVYRYFSSKIELVIETADSYTGKSSEKIGNGINKRMKGVMMWTIEDTDLVLKETTYRNTRENW